jgi:hypothetical protein
MTVPERQMPSPRAVPAGTKTAAVSSASIAISRRPARIFFPSRSKQPPGRPGYPAKQADLRAHCKAVASTAAGSVLAPTQPV